MYRRLCLLLCLALPCLLATVKPALAAETPVTERVISLPQDEDKLYLTLFVDRGTSDGRALELAFQNDPELRELCDQTFYQVIDVKSVAYRERYAASVKTVPAVRLQSKDKVLSEVSGLPKQVVKLVALIKRKIGALIHCRHRHCKPSPQNESAPSDDPPAQPLGDQPEEEASTEHFPWAMLMSICGVCGVLAFSKELRHTMTE